ncbi:hypothetical protein [Cupriavidus necator]|uniref:hypothetical protein n=1 Tax=Cupriavidus necator TaxID=106590 RepID=UPI0005A23A2A|nr:hypothetical protein [Cupriavidus necator]WKA42684.1 hypothetical protein QWP09_09425 [Cupriavidus necator]
MGLLDLEAPLWPKGRGGRHEWSLEIDSNDAQTVNFHYPTALPETEYMGMTYITPRVKLELGARGDPWPTEEKIGSFEK